MAYLALHRDIYIYIYIIYTGDIHGIPTLTYIDTLPLSALRQFSIIADYLLLFAIGNQFCLNGEWRVLPSGALIPQAAGGALRSFQLTDLVVHGNYLMIFKSQIA